MVSLQPKTQDGRKYWHVIKSARVNGKPKVVWQKYIGSAETILKLKENAESSSFKLVSFQYGKIAALLSVAEELNFIEIVNKHTDKKRIKGLTVGEYLLLNIIGRCDGALSENGMQRWFKNSTLDILWKFPHKLTCQNFLNQYQYIDQETRKDIEDDLSKVLIKNGITPHILFLDESNWFTYIEKGEKLPQKGKSKHFRNNKNLVSVGLTVSEDNIPFMHEVYEGNKHDAKIFPKLIDKLADRLSNLKITTKNLVLVFDKGNNSEVNIEHALSKMHIVASAKHNQARRLLKITIKKYRYLYTNSKAHKIYGYRIRHEFFGQEFTTVVAYNEASHKKQKRSYEGKKSKILEKLADLKKRLESSRGKSRDISSVEKEVNEIIHKDFRGVIGYKIGKIPKGKKKPSLKYWVNSDKEKERYEGFGKTIIFTDKNGWHSKKIVKTYNSKYLVEDDFKLLNDVLLVPIGPINHHKDFNIKTHLFLCFEGMLFYRYMAWRCKHFRISLKRLVEELEGIRIAIVKDKKTKKCRLIVEDMSVKQAKLFDFFGMGQFIED